MKEPNGSAINWERDLDELLGDPPVHETQPQKRAQMRNEESESARSRLYGGPNLTMEEVARKATNMGLIPFFPEPNELFLDLDEPNGHPNDRIVEIIGGQISRISDSLKTISVNGNRHLYLRLEDAIEMPTRLALQASLGSDPVRETLSLVSVQMGSTVPCALFETPTEAIRVIRWRARREVTR